MGKSVQVRTWFSSVRPNRPSSERRTELDVRFGPVAEPEPELGVQFRCSGSNAVHALNFDTFNWRHSNKQNINSKVITTFWYPKPHDINRRRKGGGKGSVIHYSPGTLKIAKWNRM